MTLLDKIKSDLQQAQVEMAIGGMNYCIANVKETNEISNRTEQTARQELEALEIICGVKL